MKKTSKILSLVLALCMVLSIGAFASGEPSAEPAATVEKIDVADLTASTYYTLTNYTARDDTGNIILGYAYKDGAASD